MKDGFQFARSATVLPIAEGLQAEDPPFLTIRESFKFTSRRLHTIPGLPTEKTNRPTVHLSIYPTYNQFEKKKLSFGLLVFKTNVFTFFFYFEVINFIHNKNGEY